MDIVERLQIDFWREGDLDLKEAADEIERLCQQNAELVEALQYYAKQYDNQTPWDNQPDDGVIARAAIAKATGCE